jgi:hypothetical protein
VSIVAGLFVPIVFSDKFLDASVICDEDDPDFAGWESTWQRDATPNYREFYAYNVANAALFLNGAAKAEVHELGPWVYRCRDKKFNVEFDGATVSFKSYKNCQFEADHTNNCETCTDPSAQLITHYNAGYSKVLTGAQNEGLLFLNAAGCSEQQITNIGEMSTGVLPCAWSAAGVPSDETCACCIPDSPNAAAPDGWAAGSWTREFVYGNNAAYMTCADLTNPAGTFGTSLTYLSSIDGGVGVSASPAIVSPLMVTKTVNEMALGYPSALAGYIAAAQKVLPAAAAMFGGDNKLALASIDVGGYTMARYGADVTAVCAANCAVENSADPTNPLTTGCMGNAAAADSLDLNLMYLGGIQCKPYSSAYLASATCAAVNFQFAQAGQTNPDPCVCSSGDWDFALGAAGFTGTPCGCIASGSITDPDTGKITQMAGYGCMANIPGFATDRNLYPDADGKDTQALAYYPEKNMKMEKNPQHTKEYTGCAATGDLGEDVQEMIEYFGKQNDKVYMPPKGTSMAAAYGMNVAQKVLPTPADVAIFDSVKLTDEDAITDNNIRLNKVSGKDGGAQIQGTGLSTRKWGSSKFNDGEPSVEGFDIFVSQVRKGATLKNTGKVTVKNIELQGYAPGNDLLSSSKPGNQEEGVGVIDGVFIGTYVFGFPISVSFPNFLYGADFLFTDINLFHGATNDKPMTKASIDAEESKYQVTVDVDPSTGKAMRGHNRLMGSFYTYNCDPTVTPACGIFAREGASSTKPACAYNAPPGKGTGNYACSAANVMTPYAPADILIPAYWIDENSEIPSDSAEAFLSLGKIVQGIDIGSVVCGLLGFAMAALSLVKICTPKK